MLLFRVQVLQETVSYNLRLKPNEFICISIGNISRKPDVNDLGKIIISYTGSVNMTFANNIINEEIAAQLLSGIGRILENPLLINV